MKQITGGITAAKGFQAAGIEAGIKYQNRKDMAIIYSEKPCVAAGTFTSNVVKAAPVKCTGSDCEYRNCKCRNRRRGNEAL